MIRELEATRPDEEEAPLFSRQLDEVRDVRNGGSGARRVLAIVLVVAVAVGCAAFAMSGMARTSGHEDGSRFARLDMVETVANHIVHRHGICLDSGGGSVYMFRCSSALGSQQWSHNRSAGGAGVVRNGEGECLTSRRPDTVGDRLLISPCDPSGEGQQWKYHELLGWVTNHEGLCLSAPEAYSYFSRVELRPCDRQGLSTRWSMGEVDLGPGFVQSIHGICLEGFGDAEMQACDPANPSQQWVFSPAKGHIRNLNGTCLEALEPTGDGSGVRPAACNSSSDKQRWSYDAATGSIFNRHKKCLDAPEPYRSGSAPQLQTCSDNITTQQWRLGDNHVLASPSLFCFSVMSATEGELELLQAQFARGLGVFGCNRFMVVSDERTLLGPGGLETVSINDCCASKLGRSARGPVLLNAGRFRMAWRAVIDDGRWRSHEWVVKVDPDAVFFAARLSRALSQWNWSSGVPDGPTYFQNCRPAGGNLSLAPGQIEVFSRGAVERYAESGERCASRGEAEQRSEDAFMDSCMQLLGVPAEDLSPLLSDARCSQTEVSCANGTKVSFHPFNLTADYMSCHEASSG